MHNLHSYHHPGLREQLHFTNTNSAPQSTATTPGTVRTTIFGRLGIRKPSIMSLSSQYAPNGGATARTFSLDDLLRPPPRRKTDRKYYPFSEQKQQQQQKNNKITNTENEINRKLISHIPSKFISLNFLPAHPPIHCDLINQSIHHFIHQSPDTFENSHQIPSLVSFISFEMQWILIRNSCLFFTFEIFFFS